MLVKATFILQYGNTLRTLVYQMNFCIIADKKQASVNEVLACLELQDTETAPAVFCIKENKNIEIFMELIAPSRLQDSQDINRSLGT